MRRRDFISGIAGSAAAWPLAARAQQPDRMRRLGSISLANGPSSPDEGFRQGLRELGYREGHNAVILSRWAAGNQDRLPAMVAELLSLQVEIIVSGTTEAILAVRRVNETIPVVMTTVADPIGSGLIASLARPGGSTTGLTQLSTDLAGKRLEILRELVPQAKQIAVLAYWPHPPTVTLFQETEIAARTLGLKLQLLKAGSLEEIESALESTTREHADALIVQSNAVWNRYLPQIANLANKRRMPAMHGASDFARAGGLISYGPNRFDLGRRAATYVDKILKGAKPSDLPVEQPVKFEMAINHKTAKTLGIALPPSILVRADEVIE